MSEQYYDYSNIPALLENYLKYARAIQGKSATTVYEYFLDIRKFLRYFYKERHRLSPTTELDSIDISSMTEYDLTEITGNDITDFMMHLTRNGDSPTTRSRKTASLRAFFKYLSITVKVIEHNPAAETEFPKKPKLTPQYLSEEQALNLILTTFETPPFAERDTCILTLFLNCGLRLEELCNIDLDDIHDWKVTIMGKGKKERVIHLNDACKDAINIYMPTRLKPVTHGDEKALFVSRQKGRMTRRTVQFMVERRMLAAGLDVKKYSTHKLRHTAATLMYNGGNGADILTLKEVLGHVSIASTQIYTHLADDQVKAALDNNPLNHPRTTLKKSDKGGK